MTSEGGAAVATTREDALLLGPPEMSSWSLSRVEQGSSEPFHVLFHIFNMTSADKAVNNEQVLSHKQDTRYHHH
jgi:hypothetical protein